jgi:ribosomal protein S18 acetylase RimI-like enzyme
MIRRARTKADFALADRLAKRCGPRNGAKPSALCAPGNVAAAWLADVAGFAVAYVDADGVVQLASCGVLPAYRGRGLQRKLVAAHERWGRARGARSARTYTSSDNWPSLANLLRCGYRVVGYRADELASGGGWVDVAKELER